MKTLLEFLKEAKEIIGMVDIVIPNAFSWLSIKKENKPKTTLNKVNKLKELLTSYWIIQEKYDGTKLTIIRNFNDYDENDPAKNWIISYKNNILNFNEFNSVEDSLIKKESNGISQYKFIHTLIKRNHHKLKGISKGTEFFLEFLMNKSTLTRSYSKNSLHSIICLGYATISSLKIQLGKVHTITTSLNQDPTSSPVKQFIEALDIKSPEIIFRGHLFVGDRFNRSGILHHNITLSEEEESLINQSFESLSIEGPWEDRKEGKTDKLVPRVLALLGDLFTSYKSTLSDSDFIEGSVLIRDNFNSGELYKFVKADQYDKTVRTNKKEELLGTREELNNYFKQIKEKATELFEVLKSKFPDYTVEPLLEKASNECYTLDLSDIEYPKKTNLNKQDDLYLTLKNLIQDYIPFNNGDISPIANLYQKKNLGLVLGKFRLPTDAHYALIKDAQKKSPKGLIICIVTSRSQKGLSFEERKQVIQYQFPKSSIVEVSTGNLGMILPPYIEMVDTVYCGGDRATYQEKLDEFNKEHLLNPPIKLVVAPREDDISSSLVEEYIKEDNYQGVINITSKFDYMDEQLFNKLKLLLNK